MAVLDGNGIRRMARLYCADYDESGTQGTPTDPAAPDATYNRIVDEMYFLYVERVEQRWKYNYTLATVTDGNYATSISDVDIMEMGHVYASAGVPLEQIELHDMLTRIGNDSTTKGAPAYFHIERAQTDTEASIGAWTLFTYPPSSGSTSLKCSCRVYPDSIGGSTGQPDVSENGAYIIARLTAAKVAHAIGEDQEFIDEILSDVPDAILSALNIVRGLHRPRIREEEAVGAS